MTKDKATVAPCEHNHGTNFNWETKTVYDNGQMLCWDCNQIYTPEPLPQTYGSLVNERDQLLAEVARLTKAAREALTGLEDHRVNENLFRLGLIGKQEVESARHVLRAALSSDKE